MYSIINGPNIKAIGAREPAIYGETLIELYFENLAKQKQIQVFYLNSEQAIIEALYDAQKHFLGVVLNAGAFTHSSLAIADAISSITIPVVEVHVSNIYVREFYRKTSYLSERCIGSISGFGLHSYLMAVEALETIANSKDKPVG